MFAAERQQVRHDFGLAPELVRRYLPDEAYGDGVAMVRQVNGVTTYLSQMATGETRIYEGTIYAAAIAGVDCVTDFRHEEVGDGITRRALNGDPEYPELELLSIASDTARGQGFDVAVQDIARWQDLSLKQFDDPHPAELRDITMHKGGASAQAHLYALKSGVSKEENDLMLHFGFLMQLLDDYLDQPEDKREGVSTLFTEGVLDASDLAEKIDDVEARVERVWGESPASRRFFNVCRWHRRLGLLTNYTPFDPEKHVPYYF